MQPVKTVTIDDIRELLKKCLGIRITRTTIYKWQHTKQFPLSLGLGRPRRWRLDQVTKWVEDQIKNTSNK